MTFDDPDIVDNDNECREDTNGGETVPLDNEEVGTPADRIFCPDTVEEGKIVLPKTDPVRFTDDLLFWLTIEVITAIAELFLTIEALEALTVELDLDCLVDVEDDKELTRVVEELFSINVELEVDIMELGWSVDDILSDAGEANKVSLANDACVEFLLILDDLGTGPCVVIIIDVETDGEICAIVVPWLRYLGDKEFLPLKPVELDLDCLVDVEDDKELTRVVEELFSINVKLEADIMELGWSVDDTLSDAGEADKVSLVNDACVEFLLILDDLRTGPCVVIIIDVETDGEICAIVVPWLRYLDDKEFLPLKPVELDLDCLVDVEDDKELTRVVVELFSINVKLEADIMELGWSVDDILSDAGEANKVSLANDACVEFLLILDDLGTGPCVVIIIDVEIDGEICAIVVPWLRYLDDLDEMPALSPAALFLRFLATGVDNE